MKRLGKILLAFVVTAVVAVGGYAVYAYTAYYRLEDKLPLSVENNTAVQLETDTDYVALSYNVGFGAYSADYSFFMDGGTESRAKSRQAVFDNLAGAVGAIRARNPAFILLQEVDTGSTRSHQVKEQEVLQKALSGYGALYAQNYDSPYLLYPLTNPHGKSRAGMLTLSRFHVSGGLRRSLPVEKGLHKFLDLDRCYSVARLPVTGGRELCLYTLHLSAYTSDGDIATEQLKLLLADMHGEYEAGNYVVGGGDFNKDLLGNSAEVFGVSQADQTWAQPYPTELTPVGLRLVAPLDEAFPVPSCRNADAAYDPDTSFVLTVDGFLVSDNVEVVGSEVVDTDFAWSDHNPVELTFRLKGLL